MKEEKNHPSSLQSWLIWSSGGLFFLLGFFHRVAPAVLHRELTVDFSLSASSLGALENAGPYVEFSIEPDSFEPWQAGLYVPALHAVEGKVQIPEGPGWGVEINPAWLCLLYTSPSPRDRQKSRMPSSA